MDRFSKTCLLLITALLAVIALRPLGPTESVHAQGARGAQAAHQYSYSSIDWHGPTNSDNSQELVDDLAKRAADGWEVAGVWRRNETEPQTG